MPAVQNLYLTSC